jgi:MFS family permease
VFKTLGTLGSILLSYGLLLLANGLFASLLGVRSQVEGFSANLTGLVVAAYFSGLLLGGLYAAQVVTRVGHIRSFAAFASLMSASALLHPLFVHGFAWMGFRLVAGFCMAGMIMVTESWLNETASNNTRGKILSIYMITNYFAAGCGNFLLTAGDPSDFELFSLASIIFSLSLVPVLLTRASAPAPAHAARMHVWELYRIAPLGVVGVFCCGLVNASINGLGSVFATNSGFDSQQLATFMAVMVMSGLILQWPVGILSDRIGRGPLLVYIPLIVALAAVWQIYADGYHALLLGAGFLGAFVFTVYSLSAATANDRVTSSQRVQVAGALLITYGAGAIIGPIVASQFMSLLGPRGLFFYIVLIEIVLCIFSIFTRKLRVGSPARRKPYVVLPSSQATSNQLYVSAHQENPESVTLADDGDPVEWKAPDNDE